MRIHSTDDDELPIMDLSQALDRAEDTLSTHRQTKGEFHMATKKAAAAPAPTQAPAPAKKTTKAAAPAPTQAPAAAPAAGPRGVPEGHVSLKDIADSLGITPAAARRKLRASETPFKGDDQHGYSWKKDSSEHKAVVKYLTPEPESTPAQ